MTRFFFFQDYSRHGISIYEKEIFEDKNMHLERLIRILETVALSGGAISVGDISAATGYPKPTCYRLVQDLKSAGLLDMPEKGLFRIGDRLHRISQFDRNDIDVRAIAEPFLRTLSDAFGVASFLARFRGDGVEIMQVVTPRDAAISFLHPGLGYRPMHACSCAKVIAAWSAPEQQQEMFEGTLKAYTEFTQTEPSALLSEFKSIRENGYGECVQELEVGICSVAAPVRLRDGGVELSVGATGSMRVFTPEFRATIGAALKRLADELSAELDQTPEPSVAMRARAATL